MSEPSAFDAAWRVVKEDDDAFDVVPYANLKPSVPDYSREEAEIDIFLLILPLPRILTGFIEDFI